MKPYHKRKRLLEETHGKLINLEPINDDTGTVDNSQQKYIKQISDIIDEEGLRLAYESKDGLYQHYDNSFIAGTNDFPQDHIDDWKFTV